MQAGRGSTGAEQEQGVSPSYPQSTAMIRGDPKRGDLGVAVIGAGRIGTLRARLAAKHPAVRFLAIADRDAGRARALAAETGADLATADNDAAISHRDVGAVIVSTPEQEHVAPVCAALALGKAVL